MEFYFVLISASLFAAWAVYATRMVNFWFDEKFSFLRKKEARQNEKCKAFTRNDFENWDRLEMILGAIFLVPIRCFLILCYLLFGWTCLKVLILVYGVKDLEQEQPAGFVRLSRAVIRAMASMGMFSLGFYKIPVIKKKFRPIYEGLKLSRKRETGIALVCNHVSLVDVIYLASRPETPGFVGKIGGKRIPIVGLYAQVVQCVFFDRSNRDARHDALDSLMARTEKVKSGHKFRPLVLFAEGTTTNGFTLCNFKKGAFVAGVPLKILGLRFSGNFSLAFNMIGGIDAALGAMMQWRNGLTVLGIEGLVEPSEAGPWETYAQRVKNLMADEFGLVGVSGSLAEKKEIEKKLCGFTDADYL